jgi:hypothetical protein
MVRKMTKGELEEIIIQNFTDENGVIDLSGLALYGDVNLSELYVSGDLNMRELFVRGDLNLSNLN